MYENEWFTITSTDLIDTPALVVYTDRVQNNIHSLSGMIDNRARLRPHIKTIKSAEPVKLMMAAGISKFKCATIAEAEMLAIAQATDVLLAYQPTGPKLVRFLKLIEKYRLTKFSCLIDNEDTALSISEAAKQAGVIISVYIDLNVGMNRTGIHPDKALDLYKAVTKLSGIAIIGVHAYDGHIHDSSLQVRTTQVNKYFNLVINLQEAIANQGFPEPIIIAGGTPTFPLLAAIKNIECSPGTFIYWDKGYQDAFAEQNFETAALVITRVVSLPDKTKICLDLGHKSIASEKELDKRVVFFNADYLIPVSQSEEHLVLEAGENHQFKIGDILYGLPFHICPTVALYERAITIQNHEITGEWKTIARDRKITI